MATREGHPTGGGAGDRRPWWKKLLGIGAPACAQRQLTPDEDLQIAIRASSDGELEHAAFHAAAVLKANPADRRATQLLDRLIAKCKESGVDPLTLAPIESNDVWVGTAATRAYVYNAIGRHGDAIIMLQQVIRADPETPWWRWAAAWASEEPAARQMDPDVAAAAIGPIVLGAAEPAERSGDREALEALVPALRTLAAAHPASDSLCYTHVAAVRKLGRGAEAAELAGTWHAQRPSYMSALALANARKAVDDIDGALAAYHQTFDYQPDNASVEADIVEMLCEARRFDEALEWAERTKQHDPKMETSAWTLWHYLMHKTGRDPSALKQFGEFQAAHPNLRQPSDGSQKYLGAYASYIPDPSEATINILKDLAAKVGDPRKATGLRLAVTSIEAPSARMSLDRTIGVGRNEVTVEVGDIPTPDPRVPRGAVDWTIWTYGGATGKDPLPGLDAPSACISEAVAALAATPFDVHGWVLHAAREREGLVARCGGGSVDATAAQLLATMVHPPPAPDGVAEWIWIRGVQFAAAIFLAKLDAGWAGSVRRRALIALLRGPVDWTVEAGIVALLLVAEERDLDDAGRREIGQLLKELADNLPSIGYCCYDQALAWAVLRMPSGMGVSREDFTPLYRRLAEPEES